MPVERHFMACWPLPLGEVVAFQVLCNANDIFTQGTKLL
jgi:hypothetical protein